MKVVGYKALKNGLMTFDGIQLQIGKVYVAKGIIKYGKNGYHMCKNLEDTLRYVDGINEEINICKVIGFGEIHSYEDEYNGYYDNYVCEKMILTELLTYEQIIEIMKRNNSGMLLWGDTGTGKTFMAGCIANALIEQKIPVLMIPMNRLLMQLSGIAFEQKNTFLDSMNRYSLLILDDFGSERDSEYVQKQIYNIIDSRYRSGLPLIVTTNLTLTELKQPINKQYKRINERILEMCAPVLVNDQNIRGIKAKDKLCDMKQIFEKEF